MKRKVNEFSSLWIDYVNGKMSQKEIMLKLHFDRVAVLHGNATRFRKKFGTKMFPQIDYMKIAENKKTIEFWQSREKYSMTERERISKELGHRSYRHLSVFISRLRIHNKVKIPRSYHKGEILKEGYNQFIEVIEKANSSCVLHHDFIGWLKDRGLIEPEFVACG